MPSNFADDPITNLDDPMRRMPMQEEPEDNVDTGEEPTVAPRTKADLEREVEQRLAPQAQQAAEARVLAQLSTDPEIAALLDARKSGKKMKLVDSAEPEAEETANYEEMSNTELMQAFEKRIERVLGKVVEGKMAPVQQKLQQLDGYVQQREQQQVTTQIEQVKKKYRDFDTYRPQMVELNRANPGLSVEELYFVAKARSGQPFSPDPGLDSERPTPHAAKPPARQARKRMPLPPGRSSFDMALEDALNKLDFKE